MIITSSRRSPGGAGGG